MSEIKTLGVMDEALSKHVNDQDVINRILGYLVDKFGDGTVKLGNGGAKSNFGDEPNGGNVNQKLESNEIPGIALITDGGEFRLTVRNPKAKNTNDAAIRLALVAIHAYCQLSGEKSASSKKIVKPALENWRAYTGNTRAALAKHPGILRAGDALSLDHHATMEAEQFMHDIKDPALTGDWQPNGKKSRSANAKPKVESK